MQPLGKHGEQLATRYLKKKGYSIVETNFATPLGEIDIICRQKDTYIFVEVKTRSSDYMVQPYEAVNAKKRLHALRAIQIYVKMKNIAHAKLRYDIISIVKSDNSFKITHIENVELPYK